MENKTKSNKEEVLGAKQNGVSVGYIARFLMFNSEWVQAFNLRF